LTQVGGASDIHASRTRSG